MEKIMHVVGAIFVVLFGTVIGLGLFMAWNYLWDLFKTAYGV